MTVRFTTDLLVQTACIWEAAARKMGNVHRFADFAGTTYLDFALSAASIGPCFTEGTTAGVGHTIRRAVAATVEVVGQNTNLGIILLLAPLAAVPRDVPLRLGVHRILHGLTLEDARLVYDSIRIAAPGGLGDAPEQDVRSEPTVTLLEAMKLAADRDMVARQYANGFADVFDFGVPAFIAAFEQFGCIEAAVVDLQLRWLAAFPDSLIARKNGCTVAADIQQRAADVLRQGGIATPEGRSAGVDLDRHLRGDGNKLNPGTTADLVTACLFVALRDNKVAPYSPFNWRVPDWL